MATQSLTYRLQALADSYKQTLNLIQELQRYPNSPTYTSSPDANEKRIEISVEIHQNLKEQEDTIEFLRQEVEDDVASPQSRRGSLNPARSDEQERNAATLLRLSEDVKAARIAYRRAQLTAKRSADAAKRKEREELFADRLKSDGGSMSMSRRDGQKKLTQDELALNAAEDVTRSLRRAHELLSGSLQQSEFAQQTLDESQDALKELAGSYGTTSDLLKSSRGLVGQLVRSQKSDTWFLMSSFYILAVTLAWLVFRRLLYGPLWWTVWQPLKLLFFITFKSLGMLGFSAQNKNASSSLTSTTTSLNVPTNAPDMQFKSIPLPAKGGGWANPAQPPIPDTPEMVEEVGRMAEEAGERTLRERNPEVSPTNSKKRMYEEVLRDEL